jgi:hypothetical protein
MLMQMAPEKADIWTLKMVQKFRDDLGFDEDEVEALGFKSEGGNVQWRGDAPQEKDIHVPEPVQTLIAAGLREMNERTILTMEHVSLWDKFVGESDASEGVEAPGENGYSEEKITELRPVVS